MTIKTYGGLYGVWGVFLVSIIERNNLMDDSKEWFDLFRVLFELVSAFGGIGFSFGFPSVSCLPRLTLLFTF
jgi:Trk-type K+ transport system membrane component